MGFIDSCCGKGFLVSDKVDLDGVDEIKLLDFLDSLPEKPFLINQEVVDRFRQGSGFFAADLKGKNVNVEVSSVELRDRGLSRVEVVKNYPLNNNLKSMSDWFDFYLNRFSSMRKLLENRNELRNASSIAGINGLSGRNEAATIGLVKDVRKSQNENFLIELEDPTGEIICFVSAKNSDLVKKCENIVHDEVIGVTGSTSSRFFFLNDIIFPEIPDSPLKTSPVDEYACFIADTHVGSIDFEAKSFEKFTNWLKGNCGTEEQKLTARKVKYLFVIGDLVDGVGVYPGQEKELEIKDIYKQYSVLADYLKGLPEDIQLIFIPGNHDALRQSEPQPPLFNDIAKSLLELSNVHNLSNPSMVNIGKRSDFNGLNVLMYHGMSYTYYATTVPNLLNVGMDKPELVGEFLLRKRHLGPSHASGLITPASFDPLIIDTVPDILTTGHIHKLGYKTYRSVNILATSCFQRMTSYMQKLGHHPTPGFVPLLNLKSRQIKVMNFT